MKKLWFLAFSVLLLGCTSTARLYSLETGQVINASFENYGAGHGKITATTPEGKLLSGEYTTISGMAVSNSFGSANVSGTSGYAWATAQGFSFNQPGQQYGSATIVGDGTVIDIVYVVDPWTSHGHGVGRDNNGKRYKLQF
ncbi:hypothetical protein ABH309_06195 [Chromobacterium piscinae]|uniref:Lipoprotein n=1 Tax=Chromobacterium piscinae TaxID=686831 RepID=A0ABV0H423_9NEIS